jgi:hypothetical protein
MAQKGKQLGQFLLQHYEKEAYTRVAGNVVIPRMNKVIALLSRYGPPVERLLHIGCGTASVAHGSLISRKRCTCNPRFSPFYERVRRLLFSKR